MVVLPASKRVLGFLDIPVSDDVVELACATVSEALRHQVATEELTESGMPREVVEQYFDMCCEAGFVFKQAHARFTPEANVPRRHYRDILRLMRLESEIEEKQRLLLAQESEIASLRASFQTHLDEKQAELDKITSTLGWRLLKQYGRFKHRFLLPAYRLFRSDESRDDQIKQSPGNTQSRPRDGAER